MFHRQARESNHVLLANLTPVCSFMVSGCFTTIVYSVVLSSAVDILSSSSVPTSIHVTSYHVPALVVTLGLSFLADRIPLGVRVGVGCFLICIGILLMALTHSVQYRLTGVVITSIGEFFIFAGFLSSTAFYRDIVYYAFSAGTGLGGLFGCAAYTGLTTSSHLKPSTAVLLVLMVIPVYPVIVWLLNRKRSSNTGCEPIKYRLLTEERSLEDEESSVASTVHSAEVQEAKMSLKTKSETRMHGTRVSLWETCCLPSEETEDTLSLNEKLAVLVGNLDQAIVLFVCMFASFTTLQSVITTIVSPNDSVSPSGHYRLYILGYWSGQLLARSYPFVLTILNPNWTVVTRRIWPAAVVTVGILFVSICASWYRFLPNHLAVFSLTCLSGASEGVVNTNVYAVASKECASRKREFMRVFFVSVFLLGALTAGLVGLSLENELYWHCRWREHGQNPCLTRAYGIPT